MLLAMELTKDLDFAEKLSTFLSIVAKENGMSPLTLIECRQVSKHGRGLRPAHKIATDMLHFKSLDDSICICGRVSLSYGGELDLHFGELLHYDHPKLSHLLRGTLMFGTRATPFKILDANGSVLITTADEDSDSKTNQALKFAIEQFEGRMLKNVSLDTDSMQLKLDFENGSSLVLIPDLTDDTLAICELFMPNGKVLELGPGRTFRIHSSTEAM